MSTLCNAEREWQGNGWQGNGSNIPVRSYSPAVHSPAHLAQCSDGEIVEIPQNNYAKAVTRIRAVFQLEDAAVQCVAIEMGAGSVTLVTLQITGVGGMPEGQKGRIMNYEIDKKLAAKEHKERKASSFFLCDLPLLLRLIPDFLTPINAY